MSKSKKKKKQKVQYIDDGRTIADMSGVRGYRKDGKPRASLAEQSRTYLNAVKMMFVPMLVTLAIICLAFAIAYLLL